MKKRLFEVAVIIFLIFLLTVSAFASDGPFGIALSWTQDSSASMTVTWRDSRPAEEVLQLVSEAKYDESGFAKAVEFDALCRDISLDGSGVWHYEAMASGLVPGTVYVYRVGHEDAWSEEKRFRTDSGESSLTFAYMGDVQPANDSAAEFALWGELTKSMYEFNPELSFAILGGDIVNSGISVQQFDLFRENSEAVFSRVPLFSTAGNHESNFPSGKPELFMDYFAFPDNGPEGFEEEFYSFDVGNCHILVLNSWIFSGEQALSEEDFARIERWMASDLAASTADWQIVITHIPVYAVHSDNTSAKVRENWAPIFERYGVDLVFVGHQHVYSRTYPLYNGRIDYENGITYIMGVSGSKFYGSADETLAERTIYNTATYQLVQVYGSSLTVSTLDAQGNELDFVSVQQRKCESVFFDVEADDWYAQAVNYVVAAELFNGVGNGRFAPEETMTRAMLATVLHRYAGLPEAAAEQHFSDVAQGQWYSEAVAWAAENGVVNGVGGGKFAPDEFITVEQLATVLFRYVQGVSEAEAPDKYGDISYWALEAMAWAEETGLFDNIEDELEAKQQATRAQVAAIFMAFNRKASQ